MPHQRYTLAYDTSDKPSVAGCLQFEADIRVLLAGTGLIASGWATAIENEMNH